MANEIVECMECSSPMVFKENMWQCENCFSVLAGADMNIDDAMIEEGLSMRDVMQQYEERDRER
jgi:ribosomal protein L37AE/L43A